MSRITLGLIGGSGMADLLTAGTGQPHEIETPFGRPSDAILESDWNGVRVLILSRHGPGHTISPSKIPFRANIFALKQLGCTHIIASGAVGSLRQEMKPRDLVIPDQIIDRTFRREPSFFEKSAVHVEFAEPFDPGLRTLLLEGSANQSAEAQHAVHDRGCYVCVEGPSFSTRAESLMHRLWGGDLVGMTAMPEAKLAREAEIAYALVAMVTDYDCWKSKTASPGEKPAETQTVQPQPLLKEILGNLQAASASAWDLVQRALQKIAVEPARLAEAPAHRALELAIWSEKSAIERSEIDRLAPLWGPYFR